MGHTSSVLGVGSSGPSPVFLHQLCSLGASLLLQLSISSSISDTFQSHLWISDLLLMFHFVHQMYFTYPPWFSWGNNRKNTYSKGLHRRELIKGLCSKVRAMLNEPTQREYCGQAQLKGHREEVMLLEPGRAGLGRRWQGSSSGHKEKQLPSGCGPLERVEEDGLYLSQLFSSILMLVLPWAKCNQKSGGRDVIDGIHRVSLWGKRGGKRKSWA